MSNAALKLDTTEQEEAPQAVVGALSPIQSASFQLPEREIIGLGILMVILQVLDGVLTGIGVAHLGTSAEGNVLIRTLMDQFGYIPALVGVKSLAVCVVVALCLLAPMVPWLNRALRLMAWLYIGAAVIPWTVLLSLKFFVV